MESQYYTQTPQQVLHAMESREEGLTTQQAQERIEKMVQTPCGGEKKAGVAGVLEQFKDLLVVILVVAAVISMLSGNAESTIVIFAVPSLTRCWERYSTVRQKNPWRV